MLNVLAFVLMRHLESVNILAEDGGARPLRMFTKTLEPSCLIETDTNYLHGLFH